METFTFRYSCRSYDALRGSPVLLRLIPALGIIAFTVYGLEPLLRLSRILFLQVLTLHSYFLFCPNLIEYYN